jgi:hypothetical protein
MDVGFFTTDIALLTVQRTAGDVDRAVAWLVGAGPVSTRRTCGAVLFAA